MTCLAEVAAALMAAQAGPGGLECDFGSLNDTISPKRASPEHLVPKLNKEMGPADPQKMVVLDNAEWKKVSQSALCLMKK